MTTLIIIDIQPEYQKAFKFKIENFLSFLNKNAESFDSIHVLYNGADTLGMISEDDLITWYIENNLDMDLINKLSFYDKGYGFFRYLMDEGADIRETIRLVKMMKKIGIHDSRSLDEKFWESFGNDGLKNLLFENGDMIHIPDLKMSFR
jgi:hypothetical protein